MVGGWAIWLDLSRVLSCSVEVQRGEIKSQVYCQSYKQINKIKKVIYVQRKRYHYGYQHNIYLNVQKIISDITVQKICYNIAEKLAIKDFKTFFP